VLWVPPVLDVVTANPVPNLESNPVVLFLFDHLGTMLWLPKVGIGVAIVVGVRLAQRIPRRTLATVTTGCANAVTINPAADRRDRPPAGQARRGSDVAGPAGGGLVPGSGASVDGRIGHVEKALFSSALTKGPAYFHSLTLWALLGMVRDALTPRRSPFLPFPIVTSGQRSRAKPRSRRHHHYGARLENVG